MSRTRKVEGCDLHSPGHLPKNSHSVGQVLASTRCLLLADAATSAGAAARSLALSARADFSWPTRLLDRRGPLGPDAGLGPLPRVISAMSPARLLHPVLSVGLLHLSSLLSFDLARSRNELFHCVSTPPPVLSSVPPGRRTSQGGCLAALRFSGMCQLCLEQILQRPISNKA